MKIEPREISVRELTKDYEDNDEGGVVGFGGKLDIRPPYQREFVYKDKQRDAVIDTLVKGYPLNVMYWSVRDNVEEDDERAYEVMDGQQRTISVCQYVEGDFAFDGRYFHNLQADEKEQILDYKLTVYLCSGTDSEKLAWFETINIAGAELSEQELRNAVYSGPWVTDAKRYFSKRNCPAHGLAEKYMAGEYIRQKYLETVVKWINGGDIKGYMATHQHDPNANELWLYFQAVIAWVKSTFPTYRAEMKGQPWGELYNQFKDKPLDSAKLEAEVTLLMLDNDVERKRGIYSYVLDRQERHLNIRAFSDKDKREAFERQKGVCVKCGETFAIEEMEPDHITPWSQGGKTIAANCQMLCIFDNRSKGAK
ncbi:HNH endonuclease family protein [Microbacterium sp. A196]|uniref:HNH endonuclease family protein n=1 Tax=Microbacterium sp. A196 TaxID=3457320 RepID=UPI003FD44CA9